MDVKFRNLKYWFDRKTPPDSCFLICTMDYSLNDKDFKPLSFVINKDNKVLGYVEKKISNFKGYINQEWIVENFDERINEVVKYAIGRIIFSEYIDGTYLHEDEELVINEDDDLYAEKISDDISIEYEDSKYVVKVNAKIEDIAYLDEYGEMYLKSGVALSNEEQKLLFDVFSKKLKDESVRDFMVSHVAVSYDATVEYMIEDVNFFSYEFPAVEINILPIKI